MRFGLSKEQALLAKSAADFVARHVGIDAVRRIMESDSGFEPSLLEAFADQGLWGLLVPVEQGGQGVGLLEAVVVAQELGRAATPLSFHSASVLATLLLRGTSGVDNDEWLARLAAGKGLLAVAGVGGIYDDIVGLEERDGKLHGVARCVADAGVARAFLTLAGERLWLIDRDTPGLLVRPLETLDGTRRLADVDFRGVAVDTEQELRFRQPTTLDRALEATQIVLGADTVGAAQRALQMAVDYSKSRTQFNRPIASFQAIKHLCAEAVAELDPVQSLLWYSAHAWDQEERRAENRLGTGSGAEIAGSAHLAPLLKAHATEVASRTLTVATQIFGGLGFTYECDLHIWWKRVGYNRQLFGGPAELLEAAAQARFPVSAPSFP